MCVKSWCCETGAEGSEALWQPALAIASEALHSMTRHQPMLLKFRVVTQDVPTDSLKYRKKFNVEKC